MLRVISLGAGVQSTTMALMAARGEIGPMPDCAIFADTGAEPLKVYRHLDWLESQLPFPVYRVSAGNIRDQITEGFEHHEIPRRIDGRPPFFTRNGGMLRRQCTQDFKIVPLDRKVRELIGLKKGQRGPKTPVVERWIGISVDEALRAKPSRLTFIKHRFPLLEQKMRRSACLKWCEERQFPVPPKSACTFCPYHDKAQWRDMKANDPESWADAVAIDKLIRPGMPGPRRPQNQEWFVHSDRVPLDEVDLSTPEERGQGNLFGDAFVNECEGMCGV